MALARYGLTIDVRPYSLADADSLAEQKNAVGKVELPPMYSRAGDTSRPPVHPSLKFSLTLKRRLSEEVHLRL